MKAGGLLNFGTDGLGIDVGALLIKQFLTKPLLILPILRV
jgi:hypothetical protein